MKSALLTACLFFPTTVLSQSAQNDSTKIKDLDEVVVESQMQNLQPSVSTYLPDGNQKKSAQDAIDLLVQMGIPQIRVNPVSNTVLTLNGQPVSVYIDKQPATEEQLSALRPEDVKKVEYLLYPTDPRYQHNQYVVNFTLRKIEIGGYAKLSGKGNFMVGSGSGSAYGKIAYKRMTFDLIISDKYTDRHNQGTDRKQVFHFPQENGSFNRIIRESVMDFSRLQQNNLGISFRAIYSTDKVTLSNTVSLDATNRPKLNSSGSVIFTPDIYNRSDYFSTSNSRVLYPTWTGNFYFDLGHGYQINAVSKLQYQYTKSNSSYKGAGETAIVNNARDYATLGQLMLQLNKAINDCNVIDLQGYYIYNYDKVNYLGSTTSTDRFKQIAYGVLGGYSYQGEKLYGRFEGGIIGEQNKIDNAVMSDFVPIFNVDMQYTFDKKIPLIFLQIIIVISLTNLIKRLHFYRKMNYYIKPATPA